jgi:hypothetical protein
MVRLPVFADVLNRSQTQSDAASRLHQPSDSPVSDERGRNELLTRALCNLIIECYQKDITAWSFKHFGFDYAAELGPMTATQSPTRAAAPDDVTSRDNDDLMELRWVTIFLGFRVGGSGSSGRSTISIQEHFRGRVQAVQARRRGV